MGRIFPAAEPDAKNGVLKALPMQYNGYIVLHGRSLSVESNSLSPAMNQGLRQIVYEKLKEAIVDGTIKPGSKLSEIELAERMAVSRTPVREAIRQLAQTGLVTLTPRRGAFVTMPTLKDASDLYELRTELEILAVANLCSLVHSSELIDDLHRFRDVFSAMTNNTSAEKYVNEDKAFHAMIYQAVTNRFLAMMLHNISDLIHLCRPFSVENSPITVFTWGHLAIIDAILEGDLEKAKEETRKHIVVSKEGLLSFLKNRASKNGEVAEA